MEKKTAIINSVEEMRKALVSMNAGAQKTYDARTHAGADAQKTYDAQPTPEPTPRGGISYLDTMD